MVVERYCGHCIRPVQQSTGSATTAATRETPLCVTMQVCPGAETGVAWAETAREQSATETQNVCFIVIEPTVSM